LNKIQKFQVKMFNSDDEKAISKDYYSQETEDFEYDAPDVKARNRKILLILLVLGISSFCACGVLGNIFWSRMNLHQKGGKQKCANNLKGIGIAMTLYSNDYRFFPHMQSLNAPNKSTDVAKVYRTLIYSKYIDNAEVYICPSSEDVFTQPSQEMIDDPIKFGWKGVVADGRKPIRSGPGPDLFTDPKFTELSYTYRRRSMSASAVRSDTMMAADIAWNHSNGFNILFGDGHVNLVSDIKN
jgi:prepilin-type processing-associated H-X9-DG protein